MDRSRGGSIVYIRLGVRRRKTAGNVFLYRARGLRTGIDLSSNQDTHRRLGASPL